ncbi:TPA: hypothetical protein NKS14_004569 [Vibrio parahaemolyticus]|uniref:hypothetical protein n=1 Tax=Shewanella algae TaxID=38313 RepID=UPI0031F5029A|nr:hypothetical protein [Vibrio parahaemolyticus]
MKAFQSTQIVHAYEATSTEWMRKREKLDPYKGAGYCTDPLKDDLDGFIVIYHRCSDKEYWSWLPKHEFDKSYNEINRNSPAIGLNSVTKFA